MTNEEIIETLTIQKDVLKFLAKKIRESNIIIAPTEKELLNQMLRDLDESLKNT